MAFIHDTDEALSSMAALVNTAVLRPGCVDGLGDVEQFEAFVGQWQWTGSRAHDESERRAVVALRPVFRGLWEAPDEDAVVESVNGWLVKGRALPQLVAHDGWGYHLHATPPDVPLATRWLVDAAMAMVDVIRSGELSRFQFCAADDCAGVLVDLSKNRSRRFCEVGCGNRVNVAAYRARQKANDGTDPDVEDPPVTITG